MKNTILKYVSDLHLELSQDINDPQIVNLWKYKPLPENDYYLAIIGDIGNPFCKMLKKFLSLVSPMYIKIFYVPGNHEYYNIDDDTKTMSDIDERLRNLCNEFDNVILLNNSCYDIGNVTIVGSTLWSRIPKNARYSVELQINDFNRIYINNNEFLTVDHFNNMNATCIKYLQEVIKTSDRPLIVLTHYSPLFSDYVTNKYTADPKYLNSKNNCAFHNNIGYMIKPPVIAWLYGHTHYANEFDYNGVTVATNQLGYFDEKHYINFDCDRYLDVSKMLALQEL